MNTIFIIFAFNLAIVFAGKPCPIDHNQLLSFMKSEDYEVCSSEKCTEDSMKLQQGMDPNFIACDDFYKHMCNNWKLHNPVNDGYCINSPISQVYSRVQKRILEILHDKNSLTLTRSLKMAKSLYRMCIDTTARDKLGVTPILNIIRIFGGWPLIQPENDFKNLHSWQPFYEKIIEIFKPVGLYFTIVGEDRKMSHIRRLALNQPKTVQFRFLRTEDYTQNAEFLSYKKSTMDVIKYLIKDLSVGNKNIIKDLEDMLRLKVDIAKIVVPPEDEYDVTKNYNVMSIQKFQETYDASGGSDTNAKINWLKFIQLQLTPIGVPITKDFLIDVQHLEYFKKLPAVLKAHQPRTIVNYAIWLITRYFINFGDTTMTEKKNKLFNTRSPGNNPLARSFSCSKQFNLDKAISYEYVKRYFSLETKEKAERMIDHIAKVMEDTVAKITWMDSKTRRMTIEKIKSIQKLVGFPDYYSPLSIDAYYHQYDLQSTYIESIFQLARFTQFKSLYKLREPPVRTEWTKEPTTINAFYLPTKNSIVVTAAFMEPPIFDPNRLEVLNYAVFGVIIAHEFSHAFDNNGHKYDKNGNLGDWWPKVMYQIYQKIAACFIRQFSLYPVPHLECLEANNGLMVNGRQTLPENIADTVALQIAYIAFKEYQKLNGNKDIRLVRLEQYSSEKLFFMQFGNFQCTSMNTRTAITLAKSDIHSPNAIRVIGSISNHLNFSEVYKCNAVSYMNPQKKCTVL
ncbi:endothelin-converting enzyme 2-like [Prorops nasuta]|uniref:endothelin-converting enzyme 2-like n=1 Tax=Prorops nasuta TaxID=863751 RepID=UPI0034D01070